jgi:hypothetical protein
LAAAKAVGPLAVASLANAGCFKVGNSMLIPQAYGTLGTTARNIFRDQGFKNLNMSVLRHSSSRNGSAPNSRLKSLMFSTIRRSRIDMVAPEAVLPILP